MDKTKTRKIKFVVFYDAEQNKNENRSYPLSSANVVDYIISILNKNNITVEIISPATTRNVGKWYSSKQIEMKRGITLTLGPTLCSKNMFLNKVFICLTRIWTCMYLIKNAMHGELVFVWHQIPLMRIIQIFRWFSLHKKIRFIFSVGELYQYVIPEQLSKRRKQFELITLNSADGYILSTSLLHRYLNTLSKPNCVLHGTMRVRTTTSSYSFADDKIHILYSGVINDTKGAFLAVEIAKFLDSRFVIHILGWPARTEYMEKFLNAVNDSNARNLCHVEYNGIMSGDRYCGFVSQCNIGLCTQDSHTQYNDCSFPSKIMTYICNNLIVISTKVEALLVSDVRDLIYFTEDDSAAGFAQIIKSIDISHKRNNEAYIAMLEKKFERNLMNIIEQVGA